MEDIKSSLYQLIVATSVNDAFFSPTKMGTTASQYYFLFIGLLSRSEEGRRVLDSHGFLKTLAGMLNLRSEMYLKLAVSCLDYTCKEWDSRSILTRALTEGNESCRIWTTRFLGMLIRCKTPGVAQWGVKLMANQLFDPESRIVPRMALDFLDEAVSGDKMNLEAAIGALTPRLKEGSLPADLDKIAKGGSFFVNHFLASANGFGLLRKLGFIENELGEWRQRKNVLYVVTLESLLNDGFSHHQLNEEGGYGRRSHDAHALRDVFVPPHLYGQLASSAEGIDILTKESELDKLVNVIKAKQNQIVREKELYGIKAAVWAVCNVAASPLGFRLVSEALPQVIRWAESCPFFSLQGTCFYALSLVSTTNYGVNLLSNLGWCSLKHAKDEKWPVPEDLFLSQLEALENEGIAYVLEDLELVTSPSDPDLFDTASIGVDADDSIEVASEATTVEESTPARSESAAADPAGKSTISRRKRFSAVFRSFSLGHKNSEDKSNKTWSGGGGSGSGSSLSKIPAKLKRKLFQNRSFEVDLGDESLTLPSEDPGGQVLQTQEYEEQLLLHVKNKVGAPIATPDGDSDTLLNSPAKNTPRIAAKIESSTPKPTTVMSPPPPINVIASPTQSSRLSPIQSTSSLILKSPRIGNDGDGEEPKGDVEREKTSPAKSAPSRANKRTESKRTVSESEAMYLSPPPSHHAGSNLKGDGKNERHGRHSVSSVASVGSLSSETNPGFVTLRELHSRRRPPLVLSDSAEKEANNDTEEYIAPRFGRSDSVSRKTQSLDYRVLRTMRPGSATRAATSSLGRTGAVSAGGKPLSSHAGQHAGGGGQQRMLTLREESVEVLGPEPHFIGITLPMDLKVILPVETEKGLA